MSSLLVFNRVFKLEIQSVILVFSTPLVNELESISYLVHAVVKKNLKSANRYSVESVRKNIPEPVLLNVYGAPALIPRIEFRQPM